MEKQRNVEGVRDENKKCLRMKRGRGECNKERSQRKTKGVHNQSVTRQGLGACEIVKKDNKMTLHRTKTERSKVVIT